MPTHNLTIQSRARGAFESLSPEDRDAVQAKFLALSQTPSIDWPAHGVRRLDDPWTYVARVTDSLLAFFTTDAGRFQIEDFVRQETLDRYFTPRKTPVGQS